MTQHPRPGAPASATPEPAKTRYTIDEFHAAARAQSPGSSDDVAFVCVRCGAVQSTRSFLVYRVPRAHADSAVGYSCVGRFLGVPEGVGCDWTIGGLFRDLGRGIIVVREGREHLRFPLATDREAAELAARQGVPFKRAADHGSDTPSEGS